MLVDQLRAHNPLPRLITNLATYATFPLIGGLLIEAAASAFDLQEDDVAFSAARLRRRSSSRSFSTSSMIAGDYVFHNRASLKHEFRTIFIPVLPSELVSALLCVLVAFVYERSGFGALALLVARAARRSSTCCASCCARSDRAERLAALQLGVLTSMIETLALRDRMTARHSAAVARYARAIAPRRSAAPRRSRTSCTPPACCTTSASSRSPTRSCSPTRG